MKVGFLYSLIRLDEKYLIEEFKKHQDIELVMIDDRELIFDLNHLVNQYQLDILLERSISHSRALMAVELFEASGIKCVNSSNSAKICGYKILTS